MDQPNSFTEELLQQNGIAHHSLSAEEREILQKRMKKAKREQTLLEVAATIGWSFTLLFHGIFIYNVLMVLVKPADISRYSDDILMFCLTEIGLVVSSIFITAKLWEVSHRNTMLTIEERLTLIERRLAGKEN